MKRTVAETQAQRDDDVYQVLPYYRKYVTHPSSRHKWFVFNFSSFNLTFEQLSIDIYIKRSTVGSGYEAEYILSSFILVAGACLTTPRRILLATKIRKITMAYNGNGRLRKPSPISYGLEPSDTPSNGPAYSSLHPAVAAVEGTLFPPRVLSAGYDSRAASPDQLYSRPGTPRSSGGTRPSSPKPDTYYSGSNGKIVSSTGDKEVTKKKKNWFGQSKSKNEEDRGPQAWIIGYQEKLPFDLSGLMNGRPVGDIWDDYGDCLVYLFPRTSAKGPSFKVNSSIFQSSPVLTRMMMGREPQLPLDVATANLSMNVPATPPMTPRMGGLDSPDARSANGRPHEMHLYMPLDLSSNSTLPSPGKNESASEDIETIVAARNMFAFFMGQSLVATEKRPNFYSIFMRLSELLKGFEFSNIDGSTYGDLASDSFDNYVEELGLADVRGSREKTIEGIVLGERMKSIKLYNEAFTHAVGKHDEIVKLNNPKLKLISPITVNRLSRAAMDLDKRTASVRHTLEDFDFPSIFSGMLSSKTADERKLVDFDMWKDSFFATRKFVMNYYKHRYGAWPPKAKSKKNDLETSGLNRSVLRELYQDLGCMYDMLADRRDLTNRTADGVLIDDRDIAAPRVRALRHVLSEYDRSSPPVKPPIPFDMPIEPSLKATRPNFTPSDTKAKAKKLKDDEISKVLSASHNQDVARTPFCEAFTEMERKAAHSCNIEEISELRVGQWLFMYAVLQALPMLVVDASEIKHTQGVEYFLCTPPKFGVPWAREGAVRSNGGARTGSGAIVSLPADLVERGVEGIYHRSHCWVVAEQWSASNPALSSALHAQIRMDGPMSPPLLPPAMSGHSGYSRSGRPASSSFHSGPGLGIATESLELRPNDGLAPVLPRQRPISVNDPSKTFDAILAGTAQGAGKKKR